MASTDKTPLAMNLLPAFCLLVFFGVPAFVVGYWVWRLLGG